VGIEPLVAWSLRIVGDRLRLTGLRRPGRRAHEPLFGRGRSARHLPERRPVGLGFSILRLVTPAETDRSQPLQ